MTKKNITKNNSKSSSKSGASAKASSKEASKVVANERMVEAVRDSMEKKKEYASSLVTISEIFREEQMTRAELVASIIEAKGVEKSTAESEASRIIGLAKNPKMLKALENGEMTVRAAVAGASKKQANPNKEKQKENIEKRYNTGLSKMLEAAKEGGYTREEIIQNVKASCKEAGIK